MNKFSKDSKSIKRLFDLISKDYDKLNDIMSFGLHRGIKKEVLNKIVSFPLSLEGRGARGEGVKNIHPFSILDLCTGTGDIAGLLSKKYPNAKIIGVDFSDEMLNIARVKHSNIEFVEANCLELPFADESFDICTTSFGLRNVEDIEMVLAEIYRVLKRDGVFVNLDLGKPNRFFNLFLKPYMYLWVSFMGRLFHGDKTPYSYLAVSNETFPSQQELVKLFEKIGFKEVKNKNFLFGQIASQSCRK